MIPAINLELYTVKNGAVLPVVQCLAEKWPTALQVGGGEHDCKAQTTLLHTALLASKQKQQQQ